MNDPREPQRLCYRWRIAKGAAISDPEGKWLTVDDLVFVIAVVDKESHRFNPSFARGMSHALEQLSRRLGIEPP